MNDMRVLGIAVAGAVAMCLASSTAGTLDAGDFARPSRAHRPETWFHLIGGNVATAGLDADLDAVRDAGIGGIQLFHGQFGGPWPGVSPQIPCLSADWDGFIRHAADGCAARGLVYKMQNCPGWSMSGGPWIKSEHAMRNLTYSRVDVRDGKGPIQLPVPTWQSESRLSPADLDYRDLFVLAFPTPKDDAAAPLAPKPVSQSDAGGVLRRTFVFASPMRVRAIELPSPRNMNHDFSYRPEARVRLVAVEGATRTTVLDQEVPQGVWQDAVPMTFACDEACAATWEFTLEHRHPMHVPSVKFHRGARLNNWEGLAGWVLRGLVDRPAPRQDPAAYVKADAVLDLTEKFRDGTLHWTPPAGTWTILRIGHVNNGSRNGPAPKEATGWECDKMDRAAIDLHFGAYIGRLANGPLKGGKLKGFVVDSWECRRQTWTAKLEEAFRAANGYDFRKKLPAVFGWVLDDCAATERFLLDWRRTLGELVEKNYYARMAELARANGMVAHYETAFGDVLPGDLMSFWKHCEVPMCEFWHPRAEGSVGQDDFKPIIPCASATHIYGKGRCAAEAFTCMNLKWDEDFKALKATANHAFIRGVTHLVFHTYTHNPRTDGLPPGSSFGHSIGTPFIRGQTWWKYMRAFTDWAARCEILLEAGRPANDVLWYLGEEVGHKPSETSPFPHGFKYDYLNRDALLARISVKDGLFTTPEGVTWKVLWAPRMKHATEAVKAKLAALAAAGGRIVHGAAKDAVAGLVPDVAVGANARGEPIRDWRAPAEPLEWIHRRDATANWYFAAANNHDAYAGDVTFRATGAATLWDPVTGTMRPANVVRADGATTTVHLDLASAECVFVVFDGAASRASSNAGISRMSRCVKRLDRGWTLSFPPGWGAPAEMKLDALRSWTDLPLSDEARHFSGTATYRTTFTASARDGLELDLGAVESIAEVFVNGQKVRTLWAPPYRCDLAGCLRDGANELRVDVTSTWFNRLAYDAAQPEAARKTWTIAAPKKGTPPKPSGLLGPVCLTF